MLYIPFSKSFRLQFLHNLSHNQTYIINFICVLSAQNFFNFGIILKELFAIFCILSFQLKNLSHEQRRHWDGREFDEYIVATEGVGIYGETPEEYLCRMETLDELMAVLDTCTEAQRRRFLLYALDGLTLAEIGTVCGCSKVAVYQSVEAVRKKFINFFENRLNE